MRRIRIIPVLLLQNGGLVKSIRFRDHKYIGDPINAVRIFNEKEVDEIVLLDISATSEKRPPDLSRIKEIATEAFIPMAYGGGISSIRQIKELITAGVEKVVLNSSAFGNMALLEEGAKWVGSQSIVVSIDVKKNWLGRYKVYTHNGTRNTGLDPVDYARQVERAGAGEIFLNAIDKDGTFEGYDIVLTEQVSKAINIPLVAVGGAGSVEDFAMAAQHGASAAAAGSLFVFQRPHRAVLISYPGQAELRSKVFEKI